MQRKLTRIQLSRALFAAAVLSYRELEERIGKLQLGLNFHFLRVRLRDRSLEDAVDGEIESCALGVFGSDRNPDLTPFTAKDRFSDRV